LNVPEALGVPVTVIVFPAKLAVTPAGRFTAAPIPVAPVVVKVTDGIAVLIQTIGSDDDALTVLLGVTVIVPVVAAGGQPPVVVTVYANGPATVGVPLIVATFPDHDPVTPVGKPENVAPVAPVVAKVIAVIAVLIQSVGLVPAAIVFCALTVIVPVAVTVPHPPVRGIE